MDKIFSTSSILSPEAIKQLSYFARRYARNKVELNRATDTIILYEDDGVTEKFRYVMTDSARGKISGAGT